VWPLSSTRRASVSGEPFENQELGNRNEEGGGGHTAATFFAGTFTGFAAGFTVTLAFGFDFVTLANKRRNKSKERVLGFAPIFEPSIFALASKSSGFATDYKSSIDLVSTEESINR
jgi:hypothetical protein